MTLLRVCQRKGIKNPSGKMRVFADDVVAAKKSDPASYLLAAEELGLESEFQLWQIHIRIR